MEDTTLLYTAAKKSLPQHIDVDYYMNILSERPEGEWFMPTNIKSDEYAVCMLLSEHDLICMKRTPFWHNGSFQGHKYEFMYNSELKY
jgi:hypothetical protein